MVHLLVVYSMIDKTNCWRNEKQSNPFQSIDYSKGNHVSFYDEFVTATPGGDERSEILIWHNELDRLSWLMIIVKNKVLLHFINNLTLNRISVVDICLFLNNYASSVIKNKL